MAGGATRNARKSRKRKNSEDSTSAAPSRTLKQYSVDEKLEIIEFAKGNGNRAAGREYNVAESSIREWRKNEEKLRAVNNMESERQGPPETARSPPGHNDDNDKANGTATTASPEVTDVGPTASSSSSSHSNSPVLSTGSSSSSRRKAKVPRKMIIDP
ncbi:unnamed protein product [Heligmosomoides polygyrus]|uniref:BrkDBD domain-containing protein n=1 Tax=Heligmosomoides polygyrus TaxID=6339 RepID=A0A183FYT4_HELPZ|nr:unnamed protein product [Heligmosomoides polygyrus]